MSNNDPPIDLLEDAETGYRPPVVPQLASPTMPKPTAARTVCGVLAIIFPGFWLADAVVRFVAHGDVLLGAILSAFGLGGGAFVYLNARKRCQPFPEVWTVFALSLAVIAVPAYVVLRKPIVGERKGDGWKTLAALAVTLFGLGLLCSALIAFGVARENARRQQKNPIPGSIALVVSWSLLVFGARSLNAGRRRFKRLHDEGAPPDPRRPILYLRSFEADRTAGRAFSEKGLFNVFKFLSYPFLMQLLIFRIETPEEQALRPFNEIGPVIAIGQPGEKLPHLGARRLYVKNQQWRPVVSKLMREARLVVVRAGTSDGVLWELQEATDTLRPETVLILVQQNGRRYARFRRAALKSLPHPLPQGVPWGATEPKEGAKWWPVKGLIHFDDCWTPKFEPFTKLNTAASIRELIVRLRPGWTGPADAERRLMSRAVTDTHRQWVWFVWCVLATLMILFGRLIAWLLQ